MSTSLSPTSAGSSGQDKSPLSNLNLGFLKSLTEKKTAKGGFELKRNRHRYGCVKLTTPPQTVKSQSVEDRSQTVNLLLHDDKS
jgi:hypothetical protein